MEFFSTIFTYRLVLTTCMALQLSCTPHALTMLSLCLLYACALLQACLWLEAAQGFIWAPNGM
jgi:hypothetical protein